MFRPAFPNQAKEEFFFRRLFPRGYGCPHLPPFTTRARAKPGGGGKEGEYNRVKLAEQKPLFYGEKRVSVAKVRKTSPPSSFCLGRLARGNGVVAAAGATRDLY